MTETTWGQRFFARYMSTADAEQHHRYGALKTRLLAGVAGRVLELGPGTGINLPYLPAAVEEWIGVEPNVAMHPFLREKAAALGREVTLPAVGGARLPADDGTVDVVLSTLVLCSVADVVGTLAEIRRVLRPGGTWRFIEHVGDSPQRAPIRRALQEVVVYTPWTYLSDGCDPRRDLETPIRAAGFAALELERFHQRGGGIAQALTRPHISGVAVR